MVQDMASRGSDLFSNEGVEAFNKCWKLHQRFHSHGERGKDDELPSDAVPHGDDDLTPASYNLDGGGIRYHREWKKRRCQARLQLCRRRS
jgi:hypothetical protein